VATLLQGSEGHVGTANGCGSPRTVSSDAGARAVVQGLNDSVDQLGAASSFDLAMGWSA
jgi:hypothetical protein